jgi:hypothetical protein
MWTVKVNNSYVAYRFKISVTKLHGEKSEKYGGDDILADIYKGRELVGKVLRNGYLNEVRGVDLRLSEKDINDKRAYFYADKELPLDQQIQDAINNTMFIIGKNDQYFNEIPC